VGEEACRVIGRVQHCLAGVEMTEFKVHMATYSLLATDHGGVVPRLVAHRQYQQISIMTVVEGKGDA